MRQLHVVGKTTAYFFFRHHAHPAATVEEGGGTWASVSVCIGSRWRFSSLRSCNRSTESLISPRV